MRQLPNIHVRRYILRWLVDNNQPAIAVALDKIWSQHRGRLCRRRGMQKTDLDFKQLIKREWEW